MRWLACSGIVALAACSATPSPIPAGWRKVSVPSCCTIALPPGATLKTGTDPIDDRTHILAGPGFEGLLSVTGNGLALPSTAPGAGYETGRTTIDGRIAETARYVTADSRYPERRILLWTFSGTNDGSGQSLRLDFSCRADGCKAFDPIVRSLEAA